MTKTLSVFLAVLTVLALLLPGAARAQSGSIPNLRLQAVVVDELPDTLSMNLYFSVMDEKAGQVLTDAEVTSAEITLLNSDKTYPAKFGRPDTPIYIALVLDSSGSMAGTSADLQNAAIAALKNSPDKAYFGVIQFNEKIETLQDFTQNISAVEYAIRQANPKPGKGTCLYDAAATAIEALKKAPLGRRALILFTDGRDELPDGKPCSQKKLKDVVDTANLYDVMVPISTIGISTSDNRINDTELRTMAASTGGASAIGGKSDLGALFEQIMTALKSQWMASANTYPRQGSQKGKLKVTLKSGETLETTFTFDAGREFPEPLGPVSIKVESLKYNAAGRDYTLALALRSHPLVSSLKISVWDKKENLQVNEFAFQKPENDTPVYTLNSQGLVAEHEYYLKIMAFDDQGAAFQLQRGDNNTPLDYITHEFVFNPEVTALSMQIESVREDRDNGLILVRVQISDPAKVARYRAWLVDEKTNQVTGEDAFVEKLDAGGSLPVPMKGIPAGKYTINLQAQDSAGGILAAAQFEGVEYTPPKVNPLARILKALVTNPAFLIAIIAIILMVVVFLIFSSMREKRQTGTPVLQGSMALRGRKGGGLPVNTDDMAPYMPPAATAQQPLPPSLQPAPAAAPPPSAAQRPSAAPAASSTIAFPDLQAETPTGETLMERSALQEQTRVEALTAALRVQSSSDARLNGRLVPITPLPFTVGRAACSLTVSDPQVSRTHCILHAEGGRYTLTDLKSSNGVRLNGVRIPPDAPQILFPGMVIELSAATRLVFETT